MLTSIDLVFTKWGSEFYHFLIIKISLYLIAEYPSENNAKITSCKYWCENTFRKE